MIARLPSPVLSWSLAALGLLALGCPGDDGTASTSGASSDGTSAGGTTSGDTTASLDSSGTSVGTGSSSEGSSEGSSGVDGSSSAEGSSSGGTAECGNGAVDGTEECDDMSESPACNADCTVASCGDGLVNAAAGETCDEAGAATATCDDDCTLAECQDGTLNPLAGETCDEDSQTATCDLDCTPAECGDGYPNGLAAEQCDDGGETAFCNADCTLAACGDEVVNVVAGEECDEGGSTVGCDADCTAVSCGDAFTNGVTGEQCDDGNTAPGDGCDASCHIEVGPGDCNAPFTTLSTAPSGLMVQCDDPTDSTCEEDMEIMCPPGWGLCSRLQHINRNTGWTVPVGASVAVGEIYCRQGMGNGAGHYTLGPYDAVNSLDDDPPINCGYGSSRSSCPSGFGCNELTVSAICCTPTPSCGNGLVDSVEEECDDANADESDACLSSCSWRVPAANGLFGSGC